MTGDPLSPGETGLLHRRPLHLTSNELFAAKDWPAMHRQLQEEGFLLVRGVIPTKTAVTARDALMHQASDDGSVDRDGNMVKM